MTDKEDVRVLRPLDEPMVSPDIKLYIDRLVDIKVNEHLADIGENRKVILEDVADTLQIHQELIVSMLTELLVVVSHLNNLSTSITSAFYNYNDDLYGYSNALQEATTDTPRCTASNGFLQDISDLLQQLQFLQDKFDTDIDALWQRLTNSRGGYLSSHTNAFTNY